MNRSFSYLIRISENNLSIRAFLRRLGWSGQNLSALKQMGGQVYLNQFPVHLNQLLHTGDQLNITLQEYRVSKNVLPVCLPLDIVYEDEDILVISKRAGMPIHPSQNNRDNSLANGLAWYFKEQNKPFVFRCNNRLDRDTSGLTVVAKHMVSSSILSNMVKAHQVTREYLAIIRGYDMPDSGAIDAPLSRKPGSIIERQIDYDNGESARTNYRVLKRENGHSLVSLILETGRTHQIRIHLKSIGFPLIGDYLYNPDFEYIHRQALHSWRMTFSHPISHEILFFTAPLPNDMASIISYS